MENDEQAIRQLVATWMDATEQGDTARILGLMSDDVVFMVPGQPPMERAAFVRAHAGLTAMRLRVVSDIKEIQVSGEWAYCWNALMVIVTLEAGGPAVTRSGQVLSILQKKQGRWMIVRDANMLAVVPPR